jgi:hypothetical protein
MSEALAASVIQHQTQLLRHRVHRVTLNKDPTNDIFFP